jgi:hypothetical protein
VGDWFSQLLIWPITILSVSSACAAPAAKGATMAIAQRSLVVLFMRSSGRFVLGRYDNGGH